MISFRVYKVHYLIENNVNFYDSIRRKFVLKSVAFIVRQFVTNLNIWPIQSPVSDFYLSD